MNSQENEDANTVCRDSDAYYRFGKQTLCKAVTNVLFQKLFQSLTGIHKTCVCF